ncbi:class I SAM-dependent methyltransferase [Lentzea sp. NPDC059081]|uniref:class I SAM-dependent methyltransferase n=1 Tax=Lentzea sp. NPDC059081 TaxID=3346719 RepID=UPI0036AC4E6A
MIPGWLTEAQARVLWEAALRLPAGSRVVEIGSHQGRSTTVLGLAARWVGATVVAIDLFVEGRLFGGKPTRTRFEQNIAGAGLQDGVELVPGYSTELKPGWDRPIDPLYVDGEHDYRTFTDDLRWSSHLTPGGEILVHDAYSSVGVTSGILAKILVGSRYTYDDRTGSLARFRATAPRPADRVRVLAQLPWFLRKGSSRCCCDCGCVRSRACSVTTARTNRTDSPGRQPVATLVVPREDYRTVSTPRGFVAPRPSLGSLATASMRRGMPKVEDKGVEDHATVSRSRYSLEGDEAGGRGGAHRHSGGGL